MLKVFSQAGYSEIAFLKPHNNGWRVRYFSPEMEAPFCGHATITNGAALGEHFGAGRYTLLINNRELSIDVEKSANGAF